MKRLLYALILIPSSLWAIGGSFINNQGNIQPGAQFNVSSATVQYGIKASTVVATSSVTASSFYGDGSHLTGINVSGISYSVQPATVTFNLNKGLSASTMTVTYGISLSTLVASSSVTASAFYGDISHTSGFNPDILKSTDTWTGINTFVGGGSFPTVGTFYNASILPNQFYKAGINSVAGSYDLIGGTQTWTGQNTFNGTVTYSTVSAPAVVVSTISTVRQIKFADGTTQISSPTATALTPWTSDIDAAGFNLNNTVNITSQNFPGVNYSNYILAAGTVPYYPSSAVLSLNTFDYLGNPVAQTNFHNSLDSGGIVGDAIDGFVEDQFGGIIGWQWGQYGLPHVSGLNITAYIGANQYYSNVMVPDGTGKYYGLQTNSQIITTSSCNASAFYGDGSHLSGITAGPFTQAVATTTLSMPFGSSASTGVFTSSVTISKLLSGTSAYFSGNVGIGTSSPAQKLDVSGTARATDVIVTYGVSASTGVFTSSITASAFYGDGSHLTGVSGGTDFATSTTVYSGFNTFIGTVQVNSIQLRPNSGQTLCELDAWNNAGQLAGQVQVDGTLTWYAAAAFPVAGNFYNASVNAGQFYYSNPAGNGQLISYNLFGGTQTFTGQNTFSGTQGISLSSYILSTSTRSVTPTQAGVLAINERYELLIATGTAKGAWMKVGSQ